MMSTGGESRTSVFTRWVDPNWKGATASSPTTAQAFNGSSAAGVSKLPPVSHRRLKKLVRDGHWPDHHQIRAELWMDLCRVDQDGTAAASPYTDIANSLTVEGGLGASQILPSFMDADHFPKYHLSPGGTQAATRVLLALHHSNPQITYCPLLPALVSLFLHYMDEERCYACLSALIDSSGQEYLHQSRLAFEAFLLVMHNLASKFTRAAYVQTVNSGDDVEAICRQWVWWLFKDLPFSHLVRVIDCFLVEGEKVLYRMGLACLILYAKHSKGDEADIRVSIPAFIKSLPVTPEELLKLGFGIRRFSQSVIQGFRERHMLNGKSRNSRHIQVSPMPSLMTRSTSNFPLTSQIDSAIVSHSQLQSVWQWLPPRMSIFTPSIIFTTRENGFNLSTLYNRCSDTEPLLILIQTDQDDIFGSYVSRRLSERHITESAGSRKSYFGTGESFLFTLAPNQEHFPWVGSAQNPAANMFVSATSDFLVIGGGGADGIRIDRDLDHGSTGKCQTFSNKPLCASGEFRCRAVEVIEFKDNI